VSLSRIRPPSYRATACTPSCTWPPVYTSACSKSLDWRCTLSFLVHYHTKRPFHAYTPRTVSSILEVPKALFLAAAAALSLRIKTIKSRSERRRQKRRRRRRRRERTNARSFSSLYISIYILFVLCDAARARTLTNVTTLFFQRFSYENPKHVRKNS